MYMIIINLHNTLLFLSLLFSLSLSLLLAPTQPISSEVTASSNRTDSVSVTVSLRGCSLHSDPTEHQICVSTLVLHVH